MVVIFFKGENEIFDIIPGGQINVRQIYSVVNLNSSN